RARKPGAGDGVHRAGVVSRAVIGELRGVPRRLPIRSVDEEGQELERIALDEEDTPSRLGRIEVDIGEFERFGAHRGDQKQYDENEPFQHGSLRYVERVEIQTGGAERGLVIGMRS